MKLKKSQMKELPPLLISPPSVTIVSTFMVIVNIRYLSCYASWFTAFRFLSKNTEKLHKV